MAYRLNIDGVAANCHFSESQLHIKTVDGGQELTCTDVENIIGIETNIDEANQEGEINVYVIKSLENFHLKKEKITCSASPETCKEFSEDIQVKLNKLVERPKKLVVLISPVAGNQDGEQMYNDVVSPIFKLAGISTEVIVSESPNHIQDYITTCDYSQVDGFVVCGGDGSYNQCFVPLLERAQKEAGVDLNDPNSCLKPISKPVGFIPTGTRSTNARFCYGCTDVETTALHIIRGCKRHLGASCLYSNNKYVRFCNLAVGFGLSTEFFHYTETWRVLKTMRYLLVPLYFYLWKPIPVFDADITLYTRQNPAADSQQVPGEIDPENKVELSGTFIDILTFIQDALNMDTNMAASDWKFDNTNARLYQNTYTSRFQLLKNFYIRMFNNSRNYQIPHYIKNYDISGYNIKVDRKTDSRTEQFYRLLLDGEYVELPHPEWELRFKGHLITVYSSIPTNEVKNM